MNQFDYQNYPSQQLSVPSSPIKQIYPLRGSRVGNIKFTKMEFQNAFGIPD